VKNASDSVIVLSFIPLPFHGSKMKPYVHLTISEAFCVFSVLLW